MALWTRSAMIKQSMIARVDDYKTKANRPFGENYLTSPSFPVYKCSFDE